MSTAGPALQQYIENQFNGKYYVKNTVVNTTTTSTLAVSNNFDRMGLTIVNTGANSVFVSPDFTVSSGSAIWLSGSGSSLTLNVRDDLVLVGYEWYAVSSVGPSTLYIIEILRYSATVGS